MIKTTPLESLHIQLGAEFTEYYGWTMPGSFAGLNDELAGLADSSAAFDLCPFSRVSVGGSDCDEMITAAFPDAPAVCEDCWEWASNDKQIRIAKTGEKYLVMIHPRIAVAAIDRIKSIGARFKVNISDTTDKTAMIGIYGPCAYNAMSKIVPMDMSGISEQGSVLSLSVFMMSFTVIRGSWLGTDGVELICPLSAAKFATQSLEKYHKRENIVPAGVTCFDAAFDKYVFETV